MFLSSCLRTDSYIWVGLTMCSEALPFKVLALQIQSKSQSRVQSRGGQGFEGFDTEIVSVWKIAFGFIGLFIGPTLLAVAYSLLMDWSATQAQGRREDKSI